MNRKSLFKNMMLAGLVVVPLASVSAELNHDKDFVASSADMCDNLVIPPPEGEWVYCVFETEDDVDTFTVPAGAGPGCFRVTDAFLIGDTFEITRVGGKSVTTGPWEGSSTTGSGTGEDAWQDPAQFGGQGGLTARSHTIEVTPVDPNTGVFPAGYYVRFDAEEKPCSPLKGEEFVEFMGRVIINTSDENIDIKGAAENVAPGTIVVVPK